MFFLDALHLSKYWFSRMSIFYFSLHKDMLLCLCLQWCLYEHVTKISRLIFQQPLGYECRFFSLPKAENDLADSHDVTGRVPIILRATLIFWNPKNLILFKVFGTLSGRDLLYVMQYVSHRSSSLSSDNPFSR